jgi:uncharacterized protein involved in type VI secretion and phage assembly
MDYPPDGSAPGFHGVYPAFVTRLVNPPRQGQVQVRFPSLGRDGDTDVRAWATLCSPYADGGHGLEILPEVGSQVLVAFGAGQFEDPYIIGACWNGRAAPPETATQPNNIRVLKSRENSTLTFDDTAGAAKVTIATQSGHKVELDNRAQQVVVRHAAGPVITLTASGQITLQSTTVDITAVTVNVHAPTANFDGIISCSALVAKVGVTSPLYSTGVGNLL